MNKVLVICGSTATGKTALAVQLARKLNGELVSADSRQVYRGMNIGTGKDYHQLAEVTIKMIDLVNPDEDFSVSHYERLASLVIEDIWSRGKLPIIVGGTGFYIASLIHPPESIHIKPDEPLRKTLETYSVSQLQERLSLIAPGVFIGLNNSDKHNPRRLVRKIEIAMSSDRELQTPAQLPPMDAYFVGLEMPEELLCKRIGLRVDKRVQQGIIAEVQSLLSSGYSWSLPSMSGLGYVQWKPYFEAKHTQKLKQEIIETWKRAECLYAKRQRTWFKKQKHITWFDTAGTAYPKDVTTTVLAWYTGKEV